MPDHGPRVVRTPHPVATPNPWYVCPRPNPAADRRLFIFPYAGGSPSAFINWLDALPGNVETFIAHYPGRGSRFNDPPIRDFDSLVGSLLQTIQPLTEKPFAFFGHSMGGLVAFELARQVRGGNLHAPRILFVSACGAPQMPDPNHPIHSLPDSEFLQSLNRLNGVPAEVLQNLEMMQLLTPMLRADFAVAETYRFNPGSPPLDCPIIAFGGTEDPRVSRERIEGWAVQTNSRFEIINLPGDHFFVNTAKDSILQSVSGEIQSLFPSI